MFSDQWKQSLNVDKRLHVFCPWGMQPFQRWSACIQREVPVTLNSCHGQWNVDLWFNISSTVQVSKCQENARKTTFGAERVKLTSSVQHAIAAWWQLPYQTATREVLWFWEAIPSNRLIYFDQTVKRLNKVLPKNQDSLWLTFLTDDTWINTDWIVIHLRKTRQFIVLQASNSWWSLIHEEIVKMLCWKNCMKSIQISLWRIHSTVWTCQ